MNSRDLDDDIEGVAAAHLRLLGHLDDLLESDLLDPARRSLLPGWTIGHVLTHLARNADGFRALFEGAGRGEVAAMYPGGFEQRTADIEAGALMPAAALVHDVRTAIWKLDAAWVGLSAAGWAGRGRLLNGDDVPVIVLPFRRWREVEIHHADLGLSGFTFDDWSDAYVAKELGDQLGRWRSRTPMGMSDLPLDIRPLSARRRLAWLLGRFTVEGVPEPGPWQ
jgi:maleylpyruvate isomerase